MTAVTFDSPAGAPARRQRQFKQLRYAGVLAKRNLIKLMRTPEQFIDVTLQPIIFLVLFYYVLGGALGDSLGGGGWHVTRTWSSCCRACSRRRSR